MVVDAVEGVAADEEGAGGILDGNAEGVAGGGCVGGIPVAHAFESEHDAEGGKEEQEVENDARGGFLA